MKIKLVLSLFFVSASSFVFLVFYNSDQQMRARAELELNSILEKGVSKMEVATQLRESGYSYHERSESVGNLYRIDGSCRWFKAGSVKFNCEYPSFALGRKEVGKFTIFSHYVDVYFFFDENEKLATFEMLTGSDAI